MPWTRKSAIIRNSVSRFSLPRMRDITCERLAGVKTSGIRLEQVCEKAEARARGRSNEQSAVE